MRICWALISPSRRWSSIFNVCILDHDDNSVSSDDQHGHSHVAVRRPDSYHYNSTDAFGFDLGFIVGTHRIARTDADVYHKTHSG